MKSQLAVEERISNRNKKAQKIYTIMNGAIEYMLQRSNTKIHMYNEYIENDPLNSRLT